jgi:magnesium transporter
MDLTNPLTRAFLTHHANDAARTLEKLSPKIGAEVLAALEAETAARVITHMLPNAAGQCLVQTPRRQALAILAKIRKVNAARILLSMERADARNLLQALSLGDRLSLRYLLKYQPDTVGAVMDTYSFFLPENLTIVEAIKRIRRHRRAVGCELFILDHTQRLAGAVQTDTLLKAPHNGLLRPLIRTQVPFLRTRARLAAARAHIGWQTHRRLPVVENDGTLVGTIAYRSVLEEVENIPETLAQVDTLGGVLDLARLYWISLAMLMSMFSRQGNADRDHRRPPP